MHRYGTEMINGIRTTRFGGRALLVMFTLATAAAPGQTPGRTNAPSTSAAVSTNAVPATPTTLTGDVPGDKYKVRAGDRVVFQILEVRDVPTSLVVADAG